jgi:hypothetical protein
MEKKILLEEIERFRLLSGYKTKHTLTENEEILEYGLRSAESALVKDLKFAASAEGRALRNKVEDALSTIQHSFTINGVKGNRHAAQEIINAAEKGLLKSDEIGNLYSHLMKELGKDTSSEARRIKDAIISDFVQKPSFIKKYAIKTEEEALAALKATGNYTEDEAKKVLQKYKDTGGRFKPGGDINLKPKPGPDDFDIHIEPVPIPIPEPWWKNLWKNKNFKYAMVAAAGAGTLALLYWWMTGGDDDSGFSPCLTTVTKGNGFTQSDLQKLADSGGDYLPMGSPNIVTVDGTPSNLKDVKFYKDGTFEAQGVKGNYKPGNGTIQISHGGNNYIIICNYVENDDEVTPPPPVPTRGCSPGYDFPFGFYKSNPMVAEVQRCVGASEDSCMGPETASKISTFLGLADRPSSLTKDIYDKVITKCKGSNKTEEKKYKDPNREGGDSSTMTT